MIKALSNYFRGIPPAFIDGFLYAMVAFFTASQTSLGTDEAAKYVSPELLFWLRTIFAVLAATTLAVKMFRSTSWADHQSSRTTDTPTASKP